MLASKNEPAQTVAGYAEVIASNANGEHVETYITMWHGWMGACANLEKEEGLAEYTRGRVPFDLFQTTANFNAATRNWPISLRSTFRRSRAVGGHLIVFPNECGKFALVQCINIANPKFHFSGKSQSINDSVSPCLQTPIEENRQFLKSKTSALEVSNVQFCPDMLFGPYQE